MTACRLFFVTGTGTSVGKTVLTGLLLAHLRSRGSRALGIKPFCTGPRGDATMLRTLQDHELTLDQVNPFYFPEPIAPLVAARAQHRRIELATVIASIESIARQCDYLLVEGVGGLLVPLGERYSVLDLIAKLKPRIIVAAPNKLGTLNHTLLTVGALRAAGLRRIQVVLMHLRKSDPSVRTNAQILSELISPAPLYRIPFLGPRAKPADMIKRHARGLALTLERLLA